MNYCSNCGSKVEQSENFCQNCGSELRVKGDVKPKESQKKSKKKSKKKFSVLAALFTLFYYGYKKMWAKGLLLLSLVYLLLIPIMLIDADYLFVVSPAISIGLFGSMAPIDLRRLEERDEKIWPEIPAFLKNKVIIGIVFMVITLTYLSLSINIVGEKYIEEQATPLVTEIVQDQWGLDLECRDVFITGKLGSNHYAAKANMDSGEVIDITIEFYPTKNRIYVEIPYQ